jgi:hypothetical protein
MLKVNQLTILTTQNTLERKGIQDQIKKENTILIQKQLYKYAL